MTVLTRQHRPGRCFGGPQSSASGEEGHRDTVKLVGASPGRGEGHRAVGDGEMRGGSVGRRRGRCSRHGLASRRGGVASSVQRGAEEAYMKGRGGWEDGIGSSAPSSDMEAAANAGMVEEERRRGGVGELSRVEKKVRVPFIVAREAAEGVGHMGLKRSRARPSSRPWRQWLLGRAGSGRGGEEELGGGDAGAG